MPASRIIPSHLRSSYAKKGTSYNAGMHYAVLQHVLDTAEQH